MKKDSRSSSVSDQMLMKSSIIMFSGWMSIIRIRQGFWRKVNKVEITMKWG
jgi:hypothetical protein